MSRFKVTCNVTFKMELYISADSYEEARRQVWHENLESLSKHGPLTVEIDDVKKLFGKEK